MKNITLAIDDDVLTQARIYAAGHRTTVNALVRDFLAGLTDREASLADTRRRLKQLIDGSPAELGPDYAWNRDEIYEGRVLPRHERPDLRGSGAKT